jgi:hypothetical protein
VDGVEYGLKVTSVMLGSQDGVVDRYFQPLRLGDWEAGRAVFVSLNALSRWLDRDILGVPVSHDWWLVVKAAARGACSGEKSRGCVGKTFEPTLL